MTKIYILTNEITHYLQYFVSYIIPILSFVVSMIALFKSIRSSKTESRLRELELYIKEHDAKEIEEKHKNDGVAKIESRVHQISDSKYSLKIWNSGKATAYNINVNIPEKYNIMIIDDKLPYEYLNPGDNFNLHVIFHMQSERKFEIKTSWENENGECFESNKLDSI